MTENRLGNTNVYGTFNNLNYSSILRGTVIASANFDGDLSVKKNVSVKQNLILGTETSTVVDGMITYTDTGGNIIVLKNGIAYEITPTLLIQLLTLSTTYQPIGTISLDSPTFTGITTVHILNAYGIKINNVSIGEIYQTQDDALNYLKLTDAEIIYLKKEDASLSYLKKTDAELYYLIKTDAINTYQTKSGMSTYLTSSVASNTYLTTAAASTTYLTSSVASNTYLTTAAASTTYLTSSVASSTYLTSSAASTTYAPKTSPTFTGTITVATLNATTLQVGGANLNTIYQAIGSYLTTAAASTTYLTSSAASTTYAPKTSPTFTGTTTMAALTTTGNIICNYLNFNTTNGGLAYIKSTNQDGASASAHQLEIGSWYGVGFTDLCTPSQPTNIFFDLRTGTINTTSVNATTVNATTFNQGGANLNTIYQAKDTCLPLTGGNMPGSVRFTSAPVLYFSALSNNYIGLNAVNNYMSYDMVGGHAFYCASLPIMSMAPTLITFNKPINCVGINQGF